LNTEKWPRKVTVGNASVKVYRMAHPTAKTGLTFVLAYHEGGLRKRQKFSTPEDAIAEGRIKAARLNAGHIEGASMAKGDRDELQAARALCSPIPILAALQEWTRINELTDRNGIAAAEAWAGRNGNNFERIAVTEAVKLFTAAKKRAGVDVTCSYNKILPALVEHAADRLLDTLSARELQQWLDTRYPHPVSRNTARKRIVAMWRWARKQNYLPRDVLSEAEQTEFAREADAKVGVISSDVFRKLLAHFKAEHSEYLGALVVAGFCGLRRAEVHAQQWADINIERGFVRISKAKRNTPSMRLVSLSPAAIEWLLLCKNRKGALCSNLAIDRIRDIARAAKFVLPDNAFRHSFISHRVAHTGDVAACALEAGNSPQIIFQHYRELFTKAEGEAWFNVRPSDPVGVKENFGSSG
jgi:integrase